jgi:adenine-specific DNA-methyltransferase
MARSERGEAMRAQRGRSADETPDVTTPEAAFAQHTSVADRKRLGQFFTPVRVADAMVGWACAHGPASFLDPATGPGIFLERLFAGSAEAAGRVTAVEIDAAALEAARARVAGRRVRFVRGDFLAQSTRTRYDAIVCNPPYIRHHEAALSDALYASFNAPPDGRISRMTNVYCLFLLRIARMLSARGRAAVITPTEFLNADYGREIKRRLIADAGFAGFVVFDYRSNVFDSAMTTATISLFDRDRAHRDVTMVRIDDERRLTDALALFEGTPGRREAAEMNGHVTRRWRGELDPTAKWSTSSGGLGRPVASARITLPGGAGPTSTASDRRPMTRGGRTALRPLGDFARCMRGIATGANDFFTLSDADAARWRLPQCALRPCVTKSTHVSGTVFTARDMRELRRSGRRAWLLDVTPETASDAAAYLRHGESLGVHQRYLTRHRSPWYRAESRPAADIWVSVFGRGGLRFVRNEAGVMSLTTFHGVVFSPAYRRFIPMLADYFQTAEFAEACAAEHRVYGDGLLKFEPRDVMRLPVPDLDAMDGRHFHILR